MKMKHAKQHMNSIKEAVSFQLTEEKWGTHTLVASLDGREIFRQTKLAGEFEISKVKSKIMSQIKHYI